MKLNKIIKNLQEIQKKHGDINVLCACKRDLARFNFFHTDLFSFCLKFDILDENEILYNDSKDKLLYISGVDKDFEAKKKELIKKNQWPTNLITGD